LNPEIQGDRVCLGHSKWATIKRKKAVTDSRRGKIFTQIIKEITIAAKSGGGDPSGNPRLRLAIDKAKSSNIMPADNIKRAIMKGTGELPGVSYEDVTYEGYGPGGVALIIESVTDNKNRTFLKSGICLNETAANSGATGSVAWIFHKKGTIRTPKGAMTEDDMLRSFWMPERDDLRLDGDSFEITTSPEAFEAVKKAIEDQHIAIEEPRYTKFLRIP